MKIKTSTIVRSIMLIIVVINIICKAVGKPIIDVGEESITQFIEMIIEVAIIIVGFWKNNSFSKNAIRADAFLNQIKHSGTEEE